ncbi:MAG: MBL fold metallo-hydrolase [Solirubrobacterales bacterium]|nr:MBL fold metallo-hydrolase [Solirubrobacterales bacterium]
MSDEVSDGEAPGFPDIWRVVADNPGPLTLTGTNTYLVGRDPCWVIDPGPEDNAHVEAVLRAAGERGGAAGALVSHSHADHTGAVPAVEALGIKVIKPVDGERYGPLEAVATPGHAIDHFCFFADLPEGPGETGTVCFTGDLILGWGSTYVPPDGGSLASYMDSLRLVRSRQPTLLCPGHGPWITAAEDKIEEYIDHRQAREDGLVACLERGIRSRMELLNEVWSDVPEILRPTAAVVLEAHLQKLEAEGRIPADLAE